MGVNSLPKTVTRRRRGCDLNPGRSAPESSTLTMHSATEPLVYELRRDKGMFYRPYPFLLFLFFHFLAVGSVRYI